METKKSFKYNLTTLSYDEVGLTLKQRLASIIKKSLYSIVVAIIFFFLINTFFETPKEKSLRKENAEILAHYNILNKEINKLDLVLQDMENRDDNIYRVIFESEPIDKSIRRAGVGGVDEYQELKKMDNSDIIIYTHKKLDNLSKATYIQSKSYDEIEGMAKEKINMLASIPAIIPASLKETYISSGFGYRYHPIYKKKILHKGMDFAGSIGTPIYATGDGRVTFVGYNKGYGKHVMIDHGFNYITLYAHMSKYNIKNRQHIKRGDIIGYIGNSGSSTGPHVHYEVRKNGHPVNPINYYFNDITADEYDEIVHQANNTGQSLD